jgi:hypothetical protein
VGAAGSAYAAFQRALRARDATHALAEARDIPRLNLADSLALVVLIAEQRPELFERAAVRWAGRFVLERRDVSLAEAALAVAGLAALRGHRRRDALTLLEGLLRP